MHIIKEEVKKKVASPTHLVPWTSRSMKRTRTNLIVIFLPADHLRIAETGGWRIPNVVLLPALGVWPSIRALNFLTRPHTLSSACHLRPLSLPQHTQTHAYTHTLPPTHTHTPLAPRWGSTGTRPTIDQCDQTGGGETSRLDPAAPSSLPLQRMCRQQWLGDAVCCRCCCCCWWWWWGWWWWCRTLGDELLAWLIHCAQATYSTCNTITLSEWKTHFLMLCPDLFHYLSLHVYS